MFSIVLNRDMAAQAIKNMTTAEKTRRTRVVFAMRKTNSLTEPFGFVKHAQKQHGNSRVCVADVSYGACDDVGKLAWNAEDDYARNYSDYVRVCDYL